MFVKFIVKTEGSATQTKAINIQTLREVNKYAEYVTNLITNDGSVYRVAESFESVVGRINSAAEWRR